MEQTPKWDLRFLKLAQHVATWSKDPSTQVGAVIIDADRRVVAVGYNGFPRGVSDSPERYENRDMKLAMVVHAEVNAILNCEHEPVDCTLYSTLPLCNDCAKVVIQSGIGRVVSMKMPENRTTRWGESHIIAAEMMDEAGIMREVYDI